MKKNGSVTKYIYGATGEKLRVIHQTAVPNITVPIGGTRELSPSEILSADSTDYLLGGSLTLMNGRLDKFQFEEGYCQAEQYAYDANRDKITFYYYDCDHLGNVRQVITATGSNKGTVVQRMDYYPVALRRLFLAMAEQKQVSLCSFGLTKKFGAQLCGGTYDSNFQSHKYNFSIEREKRKLACSSEREKNRPKVNGKELDRMHGLNTYDYGARLYNPILGRWDRMDPLCEKYYNVSPYAYCGNNPVRYIDPDGKDVYLIIWATNNGRFGHAGVAISNYKQERIKVNGQWTTRMVPDGTYTYRDLWPGGEGVGKNNYDQNISASYHNFKVSYNDILNKDVSRSEGGPADGVVKIPTNFDIDRNVQEALNTYESNHPYYNTLTNNCSDYAEEALETVVGKQLPVDEKITSNITATTPNQLYNASKTITGSKVIVDPKEKVNNGFVHGASGGSMKEWKVNKTLEE
ncbi:MAG: RHS repeat-associated core domain-containing protein [Prevotella sp.]|nr:RHS repeat-associated core domain-containing protein [Prevotella sp.]